MLSWNQKNLDSLNSNSNVYTEKKKSSFKYWK